MFQYKRIAVKIGSNVLTRKDGTLDITRMSALVDQIAELHKAGMEIVLISSGAVASGRSELTRQHYLNQRHCMEVMIENGVIPIVNENDTISVTELMFTDNDELSGLIASMMNMEALIILSNIDGIYNGNPENPQSRVITEITGNRQNLSEYIQTKKSFFGRGGMLTKCNIARKVADEGIMVIIANGKKENILPDVLRKNSNTVCTRFLPAEKPASSIKKWIAHSEGFAKGEIHINACAQETLMSHQAASLLPIGVTRIEGDFEKDDIVRIFDHEGNQIGVGRIGYNLSLIHI